MDILETAVRPKRFRADLLVKRIQDLGFSTPREAAAMIRKNRDRR